MLGEEKWVSEEELQQLIASSDSCGLLLESTPQLRLLLLRHRLWEATVNAAVVGAYIYPKRHQTLTTLNHDLYHF